MISMTMRMMTILIKEKWFVMFDLLMQISKLEEAGYIKVNRSGEGRGSHTVCKITPAGEKALLAYQRALMGYFSNKA